MYRLKAESLVCDFTFVYFSQFVYVWAFVHTDTHSDMECGKGYFPINIRNGSVSLFYYELIHFLLTQPL